MTAQSTFTDYTVLLFIVGAPGRRSWAAWRSGRGGSSRLPSRGPAPRRGWTRTPWPGPRRCGGSCRSCCAARRAGATRPRCSWPQRGAPAAAGEAAAAAPAAPAAVASARAAAGTQCSDHQTQRRVSGQRAAIVTWLLEDRATNSGRSKRSGSTRLVL